MSQSRPSVLKRIIDPLQYFWSTKQSATSTDHPESLDFAVLYNRAHAYRAEKSAPATVLGYVYDVINERGHATCCQCSMADLKVTGVDRRQ